MSEMPKNHCPPKTTAPKMEVHDASEGSKDIQPKVVSTAHKNLSQDEFQRKVAMVARSKAAMAPVVATGIRALLPNLAARASGAGSAIASRLPAWMTGNAAKTVGALGAAGGVGAGIGAVGNMFTRKPTTMESITNALKGGYNTLAQNVGGNVGAGGLIGAGLGGLAGAMMPGEEEYEDEYGRIRKRRGSMLAGALRGAGMGGLAGGAAGAGLDAYNSGAFKFGSAIANLEKQSVGPGGGGGGTLGPNTSALNSNLAQFFAPKPTSTTYSLPGGGVGGKVVPQKSIFSR